MNGEPKKYKVSIMGDSYLIASDEDGSSLEKAAAHLDHMIRTLAHQAPMTELKRLIILIALQNVHEKMKLEQHINEKTKRLSQLADHGLEHHE